ncbi:MAG: DUF2382 domain-containing protein [Hymenobacter sp.]|nr:MAG: DUF2382 domain-containing protein [Hymenobacter sp.]
MQPSESVPLSDTTPPLVIPVVAEFLRVDKQTVETGRVVLHKTVHVESQTVDVPLQEEQVQVQRVAVNRYVDEAPPVRHEGETVIISLVREEVVVTKRLLLVEELHVHKQVLTTHAPQTVELRREEVAYERVATPPPAPLP